ncbi:hypothetical protein ACROYT_G021217 [Oculina patagonica]
MLKGAYSDKFKTIQKDQLDKLKEEQKDSLKTRSDRVKELSKETNRRRKALEEKKKEQQNYEEQIREEALAKRKQEQQEATQRFQKDTVHKKKLKPHDHVNGTDKEPIPVVRDGRYVVRGHVVEVKDGKQMPYSAPQTTIRPQQAGSEVWRNEMPGSYDFQSRYKDLTINHTNSGFLYAMNEDRLYSMQPAIDPYAAPSAFQHTGHYETDEKISDGMENGQVPDTWTMAQQEKLRADAIAKRGPKLAFINEESQKEPPEGALPCIMGRDSPAGSVTSLDSLDEIPQATGPGKEQESGAFSRTGIISRGGKGTRSAGKRKVTFSDSIEFDDGVTGQLVTQEKQSTKAYTMLYARNANSYYNMPSSSSSSTLGHLGSSQKASKSVSQTGTEQNSSSSASSVNNTFGKETSVATVIHCDYPRAKPVPLESPVTKPEKTLVVVSSNQENRVKEIAEQKEEADVVSDLELNDSLEVAKDSLDEEDDRSVNGPPKDQDDLQYEESSAVNWTASLSSSSVKDSLERYVQSTAEITAEEPIETFSSSGGGLEEREPVYSKPGYITNPSFVTSGYQHHHPFNTSAISPATTSPHFYHHGTQVYSGAHVPSQGTFHPNFPYPFYTNAGSSLIGAGTAYQQPPHQPQQIENSPIPPTSHLPATNYRLEGREVAYPIDPQGIAALDVAASPPTVNTGYALNSQTAGNAGLKDGGSQWVETKNETNKALSSRQKITSPSSTASSASSSTTSRSTRSLIPRPPATKKSGKSRFHPGVLHRKQVSVRPRKANHNHSAVSDSGHSVKTTNASTNNRNSPTERAVERQNSSSKRTEHSRNGTGRTHSKRANSSEKNDSNDHDGIIESIKRNMEMMSMRTRTTAAQEQHQRILNSLKLEFGDGRKTQQEPAVCGGTDKEEGIVAEHHPKPQDTSNRRVHHPRVGSAGSRSGRPPTGISVKLDLVDDGNYQPGCDGYPNSGKPLAKRTVQTGLSDATKGVVQKSGYEPVMNQQFVYEDRRHEYPTSTVGHPTSAATTSQERERPLQARASTLYEREDSDLKRSIALDKTPTDDEINHLWAHVRSYLHGGNTKSVGSDSCVNRVDVRRSKTRSSSIQQVFNPHAVPQQNSRGSQLFNGQNLGVPPQTGGSTIGGLRRYGSHEVLRRDSSSDSLSFKRSPLLQHRASRSRRPQKHAHGQNGRPPLPRQHEYNPSPSQAGPTASISSRAPQPLSPAEMQAVMMASEKEMFHKHQPDAFAELSPHHQYQAMMSGRAGPSALSMEEQRLLQSLDRLNERLKAQEEITKGISQKPRMNSSGFRKTQQSPSGSGTRQAQTNQHSSTRNLLHTR